MLTVIPNVILLCKILLLDMKIIGSQLCRFAVNMSPCFPDVIDRVS